MALKDLLVLVDHGRSCRARVDVAARLARDLDAHLAGLYVGTSLPLELAVLTELPAEVRDMQERAAREEVEEARALFQERVQAAGLSRTEWLAMEGDVGELASLRARYSDLAVIGQTDPEGPTAGSARDLPERMLLGSGRPALIVPYAGRFDAIGQRVLVAWNGSREATRAVNDALPLLERASRVIVLSVNPPDPASGRGAPPGADIALHLARHGVRAEASAVTTEDVRVDDMLLSQASDVNADLLVMGAYGHSRLGELVLGGATRHILRQITVPVFMSH